MTDTARSGAPPAASGLLTIPESVRAAIARGQKYICTNNAGGVVCLGKWSTGWCTSCFNGRGAPRCDKHGGPSGKCATCKTPVISFATITERTSPRKPHVGTHPASREIGR